jgi:hypothetical protein
MRMRGFELSCFRRVSGKGGPKLPVQPSTARHMTANENLDLLARQHAEQVMKTIIAKIAPQLQAIKDSHKAMVVEEEAQRKEEVAKEKARLKEEKEKERVVGANRKKKEKEAKAAKQVVRKEMRKKVTAERKRLTAAKREQKAAAVAEKKRVQALKQAISVKKGRQKAKAMDTPEELKGSIEHCEVWTGWLLTICWLDTTFQPVDLYLRRYALLTSVAASSRGWNPTSKFVTAEWSHPIATTRVADCCSALSPPPSSALTSGALNFCST